MMAQKSLPAPGLNCPVAAILPSIHLTAGIVRVCLVHLPQFLAIHCSAHPKHPKMEL